MKTVLVIEDNTELRENICESLELEGYKALSEKNGKCGFSLAKKTKPDLIICDIMMPEMSGYDVLGALKNGNETCDIPFIFITASAEKKEILKGLTMGADDYITKPFENHELLNAIKGALYRKILLKLEPLF